ncbi:PDZ domain-containing protein [candidate division WWE3 bacterium]|nr:PDZ domain-containing protein [candidate division WWE3 bacterium]
MTKFEIFQIYATSLLLILSAFFGGWWFGKAGYLFEIRRNPPELKVINRSPSSQTIDFDLFWKVWTMLQSDYLERPVDGKKMLYGAIEGMVKSLGDPYTSYLSPEINDSVNNALNGTYEGIGAELGIKDGQLIVVAPIDGSPAKAAGIQSGDKILKIDDIITVGLGVSEAVGKIRGSAGTMVALTIQRNNEEPYVVNIKRGKIVIASVTWEKKAESIAYIRLSRFGADTNDEWDKAVAKINVEMRNLDGVVLDMRGNPGGYMMSAVYIAGEFFKDKVVMYQEAATGEQTALDTKRVGIFHGVPVIVLLDRGSASAAEILGAALRENIDAPVVGEKSFGKGTIQDAKDFEDGSGIHITIAKWLTPKKQWVHKNGIDPDISIERTTEDMKNNVDKQLEKAIELIKQGITDRNSIESTKED